jgi:hypothetical protein
MTDLSVGPLSAEEARIRDAADQAYRVLRGEDSKSWGAHDRVFDLLCDATRRAPLQALAIAFVAGVIVARRR